MKKIILALILISVFGCKKNPSATPPSIYSINPVTGIAGTSVTVSGSNFSAVAADNTVKFNGLSAAVTAAGTTSLTVVAPAAGSTGPVTVTTIDGTATGPVFTFLQPPTITAINPPSGKANTTVTITGTNFSTVLADDNVKFNMIPATVLTATATSLTVSAPATGSTGTVSVTTTGGSATGPVFTYLPLPVINLVSPASGAAGTSVTITGTGFDPSASNDIVTFNGITALVTSATATQIVVTSPATGTTGQITVTTPGGTSNGKTFTYITGPNIYVAGGTTQGENGYWQNSTFIKLADCNNPISIAGSGSDIYMAGAYSGNVPVYWKNQTVVPLDVNTGYTHSIFVSGSDIYTLGLTNTSTSPFVVLKYWKNTTAFNLTAPAGGVANTLLVSGTDVYVAGYTVNPAGFLWKATYWKNGVPVDLTPGLTSNATASGIFVSGSDVYVAGEEDELSGGGMINKAPRLWKNGVSVPLAIPANDLYNSVNCILVNGSDVYVGGTYSGKAALWKNGTMVNTSVYAVAETITSMFLYNNTDLYITGSSSVWGLNGYWKNGAFVEMDPGCVAIGPGCAGTLANAVNGIFVK